MKGYDYDDEYPTCVRTFSCLRIYSDDVGPDEITRILGIDPTKRFLKGESHAGGTLERNTNGWFLETKGRSDSKDTRRHIDMILVALEGKEAAVKELLDRRCKIDICSMYVSVGQGGPWLMPEQMRKLGELGIAVWWDVYFEVKPDNEKSF